MVLFCSQLINVKLPKGVKLEDPGDFVIRLKNVTADILIRSSADSNMSAHSLSLLLLEYDNSSRAQPMHSEK